MYKICVTEQSAQRQRKLELDLLDTMKVQRYEDITVSYLCQVSNIPRKAFYRYFSGKDGALCALIDHTIMAFSGEFFSREVSTTIETLERYFKFWKRQSELLDSLCRSGLSGYLVQRCIVKAIDEELVSTKLLRRENPSTHLYLVHFLVSGLIGLVLQWHTREFAETPREMAEIAADILTRSLIDFTLI